MKWKGLIFTAILGSCIFLLGFNNSKVNIKEKESMILNAVVNYLGALHFQPQDIDDNFSSKAFDNYIEAIDPGKRFLVQSEVDLLSIHRDKIDDQVNTRNFEFFEASLDVIDNSRARAEKIFDEIIVQDLDKLNFENLETDRDKRNFATSEDELKMYWQKWIKYDYISRLKNAIDDQEDKMKKADDTDSKETLVDDDKKDDSKKTEDKPFVPKTEAELKKDIVEKIDETYRDWFKRLAQDKRSDRFETYINSMTHLFDPHSDYYNPKEKEDFDIRMGGKLEGIGARLQTDGDYTKVVQIIPGGPAWKGKELEVDDLITGVTQKGKEIVDITGMRIDDVVSKIRGKKGTEVILTVKKADGSFADILIERDEVIIDEGFARSLILDLPDVLDNVGYIKLPKFYSSFERKNGNSCAKDVEKELEKLTAQNVNAVILDLRNNGGGSLQDVVEMTGLFIEDGPIVQVKPRDKPAYVYEDKDDSVTYDGPLIVMVNKFSASASEILAAALQDYNRAVIVGSTSTFGKGTVQRFVDLDKAYRDVDNLEPLGQLKITMQKFFRIDGGSTQLKGVNPDIILPSNYHFIERGEKDYDFAMDWSEIAPVSFSQDVYTVKSMESLIAKNKARVADKEEFQKVLENAARLKSNRDMTNVPLDFESYNSYVEEKEEEANKFKGLFDTTIENLKIKNLDVDISYINSDESRVARNEDWIEGVSKDFYLEETIHILNDMKNMK